MKNIEDPLGRILDRQSLPELSPDLKVFEGLAEFKFYADAIEYAGECAHCKSIVAGVVRIRDPKLHRKIRPFLEEQLLKQMAGDLMMRNHQCRLMFEGKTDVDSWLKGLENS